jgi:hypothetical protein
LTGTSEARAAKARSAAITGSAETAARDGEVAHPPANTAAVRGTIQFRMTRVPDAAEQLADLRPEAVETHVNSS